MRYVLRNGEPGGLTRVLLIESGARAILNKTIPLLRQRWGEAVQLDLVTCYGGAPETLPDNAEIFRVNAYPGKDGRKRLYRELAARRYAVAGLICSGESIMTKWKWSIALRVPAKVFAINENGDYFWLDRAHVSTIFQFARVRSGLAGAGAVRTIGRLLLFPFTLAFLILYATIVHGRRKWRQIFHTHS